MNDIFISYARADREVVQRLSAALENAGYAVWWDRMISGGQTFAARIEEELNKSKAVLVVWSEASVQSEWVRDEASVGRDAGKLIPVTLDGVTPPLGFGQRHAINFSDWRGGADDAPFVDLLTSLRGERLTATSPIAARKRAAIGSTTFLIAGAAAAIAIGVGLTWIGPTLFSTPTPADETAPANPLAARVDDLIMRANVLARQRGEQTLRQAIALLEQAVELAPTSARAWAELSKAHVAMYGWTDRTERNHWLLSREAAKRALALDSTMADVYLLQANELAA